MKQITLRQALKLKAKLIKELNEQQTILVNCNSCLIDNEFEYKIQEVLDKIQTLSQNLITLKTAIVFGNSGIQETIFKLSESKNLISKFKSISVNKGKVMDYRGDTPIEYKSQIDVHAKASLIKSVEENIESLQETIDEYNSITKIDVPFLS